MWRTQLYTDQVGENSINTTDIEDWTITLDDLSQSVVDAMNNGWVGENSITNIEIANDTIELTNLSQATKDAFTEEWWNDYVIWGLTLQWTWNTAADLDNFIWGIKLPNFKVGWSRWWDSGFREWFATVHFLHDYKKGTKVYPHIHWSYKDWSKGGNVSWFIEWSFAKWYNIESFPDTTTIELNQSANWAYSHHIIEADDTQAIPAIELDTDWVLLLRVYRDALQWNDTLDADAFLISMDLHYESDWYLTTSKNPDPTTNTFTKLKD